MSYSVSPPLPAGLSFSTSTGAVTGTPTVTSAAATYTVTVRDQNSATAIATFDLTVNPAIALSNPLPGGTVYLAYSQTVTATGGTGPVTFALTSGALPTGLSLDPISGAITGTPTVDSAFNFQITGTDSIGASTAQLYSVVIAPPAIGVAPGTASDRCRRSGLFPRRSPGPMVWAPYTFASMTSGTLPQGLVVDAGPACSAAHPRRRAVSAFTVQAIDSTPSGPGTGPYSGSANYTLVVGAPTIVVDVTNLPAGKTGFAYSGTITASGGVSPYTFAITQGALPAGLTMDPNGQVTGTPTLEVNATFTVTATDSTGGTGPFSGSAAATITIDRKPVFTSGPTVDAAASVVNLTGTFTATVDLPAAVITWDFGDGSPTATGSPVLHTYTSPGTYTVTVTATNPVSGTAATATLTVTVTDASFLPGTVQTLRMQGTLKFGTNGDQLIMIAVLPLSAPVPLAGTTLNLTLNGLTRNFTFNAHGKSPSLVSNALLSVYKFPRPGLVSATLRIKLKGALKTDLTTGVSSNAAGLPIKMVATFNLSGQVFSDIPTLTFSNGARANTALFGYVSKHPFPPPPTQ